MVSRLVHYTKFESALKIIETLSLRATHPQKLNDPFDCGPLIKKLSHYQKNEFVDLLKKHEDQKTELFKGRYKKWQENLSNENSNWIDYFYSEYDSTFSSIERDLQKTAGRYFRVISYSEDPYSVPMSAHYSDNHEGVVIEFNLEEMPFSEFCKTDNIYEVKYPEEDFLYCHLKASLDENLENLIEVLTTKHRLWKYEKEVRILIPPTAIQDKFCSQYIQEDQNKKILLKFPAKAIKRIFTGMKMDQVEQGILKTLVRECLGDQVEIIPLVKSKDKYSFTDG